MADSELFPQLPGRSGDSLREWLAAGGPEEFHRQVQAWLSSLPPQGADFWFERPRARVVEALIPTRPWANVPRDLWGTRNVAVYELRGALSDVAAAKAAKGAKSPGARASLTDALQRRDGVQEPAEREYEQVRVGVNDAVAQVAAGARVGSKTPSPPAIQPVTLR